jgi:hypothetical protein
MPPESTTVILDHPGTAATPPGQERWAQEVAAQQRTAKERHKAAKPETPQESEGRIYREWHEGTSSKKMTFNQQLLLAEEYSAKFADTKTFDNMAQLKSVRDWLEAQNNRPSIEVDLQKNIESHKPPTNNEVGLAIANYLGFTDSEIALYAAQKGIPLNRAGEAFFQTTDSHANEALLKQAEKNQFGIVRIGEMHSGAIAETKQWLSDYRSRLNPNPIDSYDWAKERTWSEAVATHLLVPTAGAVGSLSETVGDIVQGLGLPAHLVYSRTFMDTLGETLRKKGQSMDMTALYTQDEMNDAVVALVNVYAHAAGSAAPFLVPGAIATRFAAGAEALDALGVAADSASSAAATAQMPARALTLASELMGGAANGGQVYDAALTLQCRRLAEDELAGKPHSAKDVEDRIAQMKAGNLDQKQLQAIDRKSLIAAAFAAPVGVVQGRWLNEMSMELGRGVTPGELPESLVLNVRNELITGGLISTTQLVSNEGSQVLAGVKSPTEAGQAIREGVGDAALSGAMIGGTVGAGKGALDSRSRYTEVDPLRGGSLEPVYLQEGKQVRSTSSEPTGSHEPVTTSPLSEPQLANSFSNRFSKIATAWDADSGLVRDYNFINLLERDRVEQRDKLDIPLTAKLTQEELERFNTMPADQAVQDIIAKKAPELAEQYADYLTTLSRLDKLHTQVNDKIAARHDQIQSELDQFNKEAGLPKVRVEIVPDAQMGEANASYSDGVMRLRESTVTGQDSVAGTMRAMAHELTHAEQDYLITRRFADQAKVGVEATPEQIAVIKDSYKKANLGEPDDARLKEALAMRNGRTLTETEGARADALALSFSEVRQNSIAAHDNVVSKTALDSALRMTKISPSMELHSLEDSIERQSQTAKLLFPDGVPAEITKLIEDSRKPGFDSKSAGPILLAALNQRAADLDAQKQQIFQTYMNFTHEREARATGAAVSDKLPDSAHETGSNRFARSFFDIK